MDIVEQNGESSRNAARRSPSPRKLLDDRDGTSDGSDGIPNGEPAGTTSRMVEKSRLILPEWDVPPLKPLHPSHDFISLLSLAPLYNTYVRPYASHVEDDIPGSGGAGVGGGVDGEGGDEENDAAGAGGVHVNGVVGARRSGVKGTGGKAKKFERGYISLLEDCIDPTPEGTLADPSLIPLIHDLSFPPTGHAPELWAGPIDILPEDKWSVARLQIGSQAGYRSGEKAGVRQAEEKRQRRQVLINQRRRREREQAAAAAAAASAKSGLPAGQDSQIYPAAPGTPLLPVLPPSRSSQYPQSAGPAFGATRRQSNSAGLSGTIRTAAPPPINPAHSHAISSAGNSAPLPGVGMRNGQPGSATGSRGQGQPTLPAIPQGSNRPSTPNIPPGHGHGTKRVYEGPGAGMTKKAKLAGTRSASPMPSGPPVPSGGQNQSQKSQQARSGAQGELRPGFGKGGRARTEGA